jgi:hypothetical protein
MAKTWVALGAAVAISAAVFTHSTPAAAHDCGYYGGGCYDNVPRGLFTSGFFGGWGCGCGSWHNPADNYAPTPYESYGPAPYHTEPYMQNYTHPYVGPYYRHSYHPYLRHSLYGHGVYHRYGAYHGRGVYRAHYNNGHMRHW